MPGKSQFKKIDANKYQDFINIADDFFNGGKTAYEFEYYNAAGVLIIHASIALADAVTVKLSSKKCSGDSHYEIISLLNDITPPSTQKNNAIQQLRKLIDHKKFVSIQEKYILKKTSRN